MLSGNWTWVKTLMPHLKALLLHKAISTTNSPSSISSSTTNPLSSSISKLQAMVGLLRLEEAMGVLLSSSGALLLQGLGMAVVLHLNSSGVLGLKEVMEVEVGMVAINKEDISKNMDAYIKWGPCLCGME